MVSRSVFFVVVLGAGMLLSSAAFAQSDSLATVHFYSAKNSDTPKKNFKLYKGNSIVSDVTDGSEVIHRCKPGLLKFHLKGDSDAVITMDVKAGEVYYVEFSLPTQAKSASPMFKQKTKGEGKSDLKKLYTEDKKP